VSRKTPPTPDRGYLLHLARPLERSRDDEAHASKLISKLISLAIGAVSGRVECVFLPLFLSCSRERRVAPLFPPPAPLERTPVGGEEYAWQAPLPAPAKRDGSSGRLGPSTGTHRRFRFPG